MFTHGPSWSLFVPHRGGQQVAIRRSVAVHMTTKNLANERGELVIALLGSERLEVCKQRRAEAQLHLVGALLRLGPLGNHVRQTG